MPMILRVRPAQLMTTVVSGSNSLVMSVILRASSPPGMGIEIAAIEDQYGSLVDRIASNFLGIKILLAIGAGHDRIRQMLHRHLAATVACEIEDVEDPFVEFGDKLLMYYQGGSGYSDACVLPDGRVAVLFEKDGKTKLGFTIVPAPPATPTTK